MRVITYNVGRRALSKAVIDSLNPLQADVCLFQEIEEYEAGSTEIIARESGFDSVFASSRSLQSEGKHGLAIISKYPIISSETVSLPKFNLGFNSRNRIALIALIQSPNKVIQICNVHLDTRLNAQERINQLSPLFEPFNNSKSPIILGGDFNTIPFKLWRNILPTGFVKQNIMVEQFLHNKKFKCIPITPSFTFRYGPVKFHLDSIYSLGLEITNHGIYSQHSKNDHLPVWADFK